MSFFSELNEKINKRGSYTLVNYGGRALYIEGIKRIIDLGIDAVTLAVKEGELVVEGRGLSVLEVEDGTMIIKGAIEKSYVKVERNDKNHGV